MGMRLARHLGPKRSLEAGQYMVDPGWPSTVVRREVIVACPGCGEHVELTDTHKVSIGGRVSPIFSCPSPACPVLEHLQFEAWAEEILS